MALVTLFKERVEEEKKKAKAKREDKSRNKSRYTLSTIAPSALAQPLYALYP